MSRLGNHPIAVPDEVEVSIKGSQVSVKGPRGEMGLSLPDGITADLEDGMLQVSRRDDTRGQKMYHGTYKRHLENLVKGVSTGHAKTLIVNGKGYQAEVKGKVIEMQIGFSHRVLVEVPEGVEVEVKPGQNTFTLDLRSNDKHLVGTFADVLYKLRPVEPYNQIGFRYSDQRVKTKAAKIVTT